MSDWKKVKLGDISSAIQTGPFGSQLHQSDYSDIGVPVVMPKDIVNGCIDESTIARVEYHHVERLSRHKISEGDIIYARRGDVGKCAYTVITQQGWLCGTGCLRVTIDKEKALPKFVFFQLQRRETIGWVEKHAIGATMLNLNTSILGDVPIELPPLSIQHRISTILSRYDSLIENYQKQIKLLEEAAQRLYKEWFVDLHFPGHENTKIIDGVPEGWEKKKVTDILDVKYGKDHKQLKEGNVPVDGTGGVMRYVDCSLYTGESVLIPRKGSLNNIMYVNETFWTIDTMFYSIPKIENAAKIVYFYLKGLDMYSMNIGAAVPSMTISILSGMGVLLPTNEISLSFEGTITKYFDEIKNLSSQIRLLTEARDRLLPKLMTGEIELEGEKRPERPTIS